MASKKKKILDQATATSPQAGDFVVTDSTTRGPRKQDISQFAQKNNTALTGTPTAPTATVGDATERIATTMFVANAIAQLINSAPGAMDTLKELSDALGGDENFAATVMNLLAGKLDKSANLSDLPSVSQAKQNLGIHLVDNTPDANKPISSDVAAALALKADSSALALKANLASPALTGTPTAPTAASGTNTTQIATTAFVVAAITQLINSAPGVLDTLDEIAQALNNDPDFAASIAAQLAAKAPLASPNLSGTPTAPTASASTNSDQIATTAFVVAAIATAVAAKANIASPTFTGIPAAPTAAAGTATTQIATTGFVANAIAELISSAPGALNTLNELAAALGNDANFAASVTNALALKANLASPAFTGTPTAPTAASGTNSTQIATTAFVAAALAVGLATKADTESPSFTGTPSAPTAAPGTNSQQLATTAYVVAAVAAGLAAKADIASPAFTGTPTAPTATAGTSTTQLATTAFVSTAVSNAIAALLNSAPGALDTLNELAAALGNDANFAANVMNAIGLRATIASPAFTGTPTAPTPAPGTNTTQLATTAFVVAAIAAAIEAVAGSAVWGGITGTLADQTDLQDALAEKAPVASPTFTGTPAAPTAAPGTSTTQIATTSFVTLAISTALANLIASAPGALDTLNELAAALGDDENFAANVTASIALKAPLASPALTGSPTAPTPTSGNNSTLIATTAFVVAAIATAVAPKADLASPALTGTPTAPTATSGTNTTQVATTAFVATAVNNAITALLNSAPGALDTLKELADALGNDANFAATVTNALALKAPLASPAFTGTPTAPTAAPGTNTTQLATTAFVAAAVAGVSGGARTPNDIAGGEELLHNGDNYDSLNVDGDRDFTIPDEVEGDITSLNFTLTAEATITFPRCRRVRAGSTGEIMGLEDLPAGHYELSFKLRNGVRWLVDSCGDVSETPYVPPTVATPTFNPAQGLFNVAQNVEILCATSGATIHFTTDGSTPTTSSPVYSTPLPVNATTTIKALAVKVDHNNSTVATGTFTIDTTAPTLTSVQVLANGTTVRETWSENMQHNAGGSGSHGRTITLSGGAVTLSSPVITGSQIDWTASRTILAAEGDGTFDYTAPTNGKAQDLAGNNAANISGATLDNNSTQVEGGSEVALLASFSGGLDVEVGDPNQAGIKFTVGASPITVTKLGFRRTAATFANQTVKLFDADGTTELGSVSVDYTQAPAGNFVYGAITPVVVPAGAVRHLRLVIGGYNGFTQTISLGSFTPTAAATITDFSNATGSNADGVAAAVDLMHT